MTHKTAAILLCGVLIFCMLGCKDNAEPLSSNDPNAQNEPNAYTIASIPTPEFIQRVEALRAQGYPVSLDDLEIRYKLPEGVENAADVYIEAFKHYQEPTEVESEYLPIMGKYYEPDKKEPPYPQECMDAMKSFLSRNEKTLELIDKAARMEHCMMPRKRQDAIFISDDCHGKIIKASKLVYERNLYLAQNQKADALAESLQTSFALSDAIVMQPNLFDFLTVLRINVSAMKSLEDALNLTTFNEEQLIGLQQSIREIQKRDIWPSVLANERVGIIEYCQFPVQKHIEDYLKKISDAERSGTQVSKEEKDKIIQYFESGLHWKDTVRIMDCYQVCFDSLQQPIYQQSAELTMELEKIDRAIEEEPFSHLFLVEYGPRSVLSSTMKNFRPIEMSAFRCAETALAVEWYRFWYKNVPESLDELVPDFIAAVPLDPFDGKPLRYKLRDTEGYILYTIGKDGIDNGGLTREQAGKMTEKYPPEFDHTFIVER